jgi:16S rRNA (guanine527-N7)-methyltransferase
MEKFAKEYFELLVGEYSGINLTRINDYDSFYNLQIKDSIIPYEKSEKFKKDLDNKRFMIDIGFGGGFPILPMAHLLPKYNFLGIETRNKKCKVVGEISSKLSVNNTKFLHNRIENVLIDVPSVITLKAVGKVDQFLEKINATKDITVYFYKARNFYEIEKEALTKVSKDWDIVEEIDIEVPSTERRILIGFKPKKVPCGTNNNKDLVKVSKFQ